MQLGFVSFGGPAGQIAILHREIVERRRWVAEDTFNGALNFCMLLPGPEALQLAIFLGWRLHGLRGGLVAGLGFIVPSVLLLFALAFVYANFGALPWLAAIMSGLKAAVVALVLQALWRIARRALRTPLHVALALGSFVALQFAGVPFPWVLLVAALAGALLLRAPATPGRAPEPRHASPTIIPAGASQRSASGCGSCRCWRWAWRSASMPCGRRCTCSSPRRRW